MPRTEQLGRSHGAFTPLLFALGWILLDADPLAAWGPATHVALGQAVLGSLYLLTPGIRLLLERFSLHFLYGSIATDIYFAKKYVPEGRHCHNWEIGEEILASADSEPMRAVGYGYLTHLATDTIAHNTFVPRQLLLNSTTQALDHTYWEHRMDMHVGVLSISPQATRRRPRSQRSRRSFRRRFKPNSIQLP